MTKLVISFVALEGVTVAMPFLIAFVFGRGVTQLSVLWALLAVLLVSSLVIFRQNRSLAVSGFITLALTFLFMVTIPSVVRSS